MPDKKIYLPDARTRLYGIVGNPVEHSLSPVMHNAAFRHLGMNAVYLAFCPEGAEGAVEAVRHLGIEGLSVTIPFKEDMIPLMDEVDEVVSSIGALNTIANRQGRLVATNTDWLGAVQALVEAGARLQGADVLVIGAGGSARAVVYGLKHEGAKVTVANRTVAKAARLAEEFGCSFCSLEEAAPGAEVVINTTSVGMAPHTDAMPVEAKVIEGAALVMDIVYSPLETRLLKEAKAKGAKTVDGLRMLLHQAVAQFEFWTGRKAPAEVMEDALYKAHAGRRSRP